jgi:hypothetical protein
VGVVLELVDEPTLVEVDVPLKKGLNLFIKLFIS